MNGVETQCVPNWEGIPLGLRIVQMIFTTDFCSHSQCSIRFGLISERPKAASRMAAGPVSERNQDATIYVGGLDEKVTHALLS